MSSDNYGAIDLNSLLNKVFDYILINLLANQLNTSDPQFPYKLGQIHKSYASTYDPWLLSMALWWHKLLITTTHKAVSCVLSLFLDASKAFDKAERTKLFKELLNKKVCPVITKDILYF